MTTMSERVRADHVRSERKIISAPAESVDFPVGTNWYRVTLHRHGRQLSVPFGMGPALTHEPTAAEVLACLTSEAVSYDQSIDVWEWAEDYGMADDSARARKLYARVGAQSRKLRRFLGDAYDAYLYETEDDS